MALICWNNTQIPKNGSVFLLSSMDRVRLTNGTNLLLEASIFALSQRATLERLCPVLLADQGKLLRRFLRQFLRIATVPNEHLLANFRDRGVDVQQEIALHHRWPFDHTGTRPCLLDAHCDDVVGFAREEIADVCLLWLPLAEFTTLRMKEAANLQSILHAYFIEAVKIGILPARSIAGAKSVQGIARCRASDAE